MYHFVDDKEKLNKAKHFASEIALAIQDAVRENGINCQIFLIGSGARNLVTQNGSEPFDFDYNLNILSCEDWDEEQIIKETIREAGNRVMREYGLDDLQDSTSSLTTCQICLTDKTDITFSIDIGIVTLNNGGIWERLIHDKRLGRYYWNEVRNSKSVNEKATILKKNNYWPEVRDRYLEIKNKYLRQNDYNHPSFICYIEAVNEIYQKRGKNNVKKSR